MESVKLSKSLRKLMKKSTDKFVKDLYFNANRRKELRKSFVKAQDGFLKILREPLGSNLNADEIEGRYWAEVFLDQMSGMIDVIDNVVPKRLKKIELSNTSFNLFKKPDGKFTAIECKYDKGIPKKHYRACLLIPSGFPRRSGKTKARIVRGPYDLKGFELQDQGTFTQKFTSFVKVQQKFKGKKGTIKFELTQRGKTKDNKWLRIIG